MQTRDQWANILKDLRQTDQSLLTAIENIPVSFTHDTIILTAPNKSVYDMLVKNNERLGNAIIKIKSHEKDTMTIEQKLRPLFGDKLEIK